jgi:hypothetical protein
MIIFLNIENVAAWTFIMYFDVNINVANQTIWVNYEVEI